MNNQVKARQMQKMRNEAADSSFRRRITERWNELRPTIPASVGENPKVFVALWDGVRLCSLDFAAGETLDIAYTSAMESASKRTQLTRNPKINLDIYVVTEERTVSVRELIQMNEPIDGMAFDPDYKQRLVYPELLPFPLCVQHEGQAQLNDRWITRCLRESGCLPKGETYTSNLEDQVILFRLSPEPLPYNPALFADKANALKKQVLSLRQALDNPYVVFLSVGTLRCRAAVFSGAGDTLSRAWDEVCAKAETFARRNRIEVDWLKADVIAERRKISLNTWKKEKSQFIFGNPGAFHFRRGISFDNEYRQALISMELNASDVWNCKRGEHAFQEDNLKDAFARKGLCFDVDLSGNPEIIQFKTAGFLCETPDAVIPLRTDDENYGRRLGNFSREELIQTVKTSAEWLISVHKPDGSFRYGHMADTGKILTNYNSLRHAGTVMSIIQYCDLCNVRTDEISDCIRRANQWLVDEMVFPPGDEVGFLTDKVTNEIKLGGNAVSILALEWHMRWFNNDEYMKKIKLLANGILALQMDDGSFWHVLNLDFSPKEKERIVYYDGEAVYALIRAYSVTKNEDYLDAAEKTICYFIDSHYEKHCDHWVAYSLNEITKHRPKQKYFDFSLLNAQSNLRTIYNRKTPFHTYLELLMATKLSYQRLESLIAKGENFTVPDFFKPEELERTIRKRIDYMLNSFLSPEFAMYMKYPGRDIGTYAVRHQGWRIRIDDLQHFLGGYYEFLMSGMEL